MDKITFKTWNVDHKEECILIQDSDGKSILEVCSLAFPHNDVQIDVEPKNLANMALTPELIHALKEARSTFEVWLDGHGHETMDLINDVLNKVSER